MIEVRNTTVKISDISKLLKGNPVDAIFESINKIWRLNLQDDYYPKGEKLTSKFEKQIYGLYPEIYSIILHNIERNRTITDILGWENYCLVIMDGMSLREANFTVDDLKSFGSVRLNYTYSAIPSETEFFTKKNFGSSSPSQIKGNGKFEYFHIQREDEIEKINPGLKRVVIWSTFPDQMFTEFKTGFETKDLERVGRKTKSLILKLLEQLTEFEKIIITSDHGYFVDTFSWKGLSDFPTGERYAEHVPQSLQKYCRFTGDYWVLVGRYNTIKRGKYVHVRHGGLSFLETIIPLIEIEINRDGGEEDAIY